VHLFAVGNIAGGNLADRTSVQVVVLTVIFLWPWSYHSVRTWCLPYTHSRLQPSAVAAFWGGFAFANVPPLQS